MNPVVLRILDANANRAREALRVIEDYARFALNDDAICGSFKQLRHDLAEATAGFVGEAILFRDTPGDVGTSTKTLTESQRNSIGHVVIAAGKRLGEALRTLEEFHKTIDPMAASRIEKIRYRFYDLEQQIARTIRPVACDFARVRLYVLLSEKLCKAPWLEVAQEAIRGGADCIQLREKELDAGEFLCRARRLVDLCRLNHVMCIINDRPDIAILSDADGVHVGQGDLPAEQVRKLVGSGKIVGVSTHNIQQARQAVRDGADYIGVGPIFRSDTKPRDFLPGLEFAREVVAAKLPIPAIAIAGITPGNVDDVIQTGISAVAVSAAVIGSGNVRAAAETLKQRLSRGALPSTPSAAQECAPPAGQTFVSVVPWRTFLSAVAGGTVSPGIPDAEEQARLSADDDEGVMRRYRHWPHWTMAGATYFVTFRSYCGEFTMAERLVVLDHIKGGAGRFYDLLAGVVMPDHVHILIQPLQSYSLSRIMKGVKGVSARLINQLRDARGVVWEEESFDRIVRDENEFEEKMAYIVNNAAKRELVADPWDYAALYVKFE